MNHLDLMSPKQVIERLDIPSSTLYRWVSDGHFPRPIKIGPRKTAFRTQDIELWLKQQSENLQSQVDK